MLNFFTESTASSPLAITVDTTAPAASTLAENTTTVLTAGGWNASETTSTVRATLSSTAGATKPVAGDSIELLLGGSAFSTPKTVSLSSTNISNGYVDFTVLTADLGSDGAKVLSAKVTDIAGNVGSAGSLTSFVLDTTPPTVSSFTSTTADNSFNLGDTINITATMSEAVADGATFVVTLETGSTDRTVTLTKATSTTLTGTYTVQAGDNTTTDISSFYAALAVLSYTAGTVGDIAGNAAVGTSVPSTNISTRSAIVIDTTNPTAPTIALTTDTGSSNSDGITSNNGVTVSGLEAGATWQYTLDATAGTPTWVTGTGSSFNMDADTTYANNKLGVRQTDAAGNVSTIVKNAAQWVEDSTDPAKDSTTPIAYNFNDTITITLTFSEELSTLGTPSFADHAGTARTAVGSLAGDGLSVEFAIVNDSYASFRPGDIITLTGALDLAGNDANLTFTLP